MQKRIFFGLLIAAAAAGTLQAQAPGGAPSVTFPWWTNRVVVSNLNLSEAQTKQLTTIVDEYRDRLKDLYSAVNKAEGDLQEVFNQDPVDQRKGHLAVDQYANAKGDLTRTLSAMSLELRSILTAQQWADLQVRPPGRGGARGGQRRRGPPPVTGSGPRAGAATAQK